MIFPYGILLPSLPIRHLIMMIRTKTESGIFAMIPRH